MFKDIVNLFTFINKSFSTEYNNSPNWSKVYITYWRMQGVIKNAKLVLDHYFTLSLKDGCLINTRETPFNKWRNVVNKDFEQLSASVKDLSIAFREAYQTTDLYPQEDPAYQEYLFSFSSTWFEVFQRVYRSGYIEEGKEKIDIIGLSLSKAVNGVRFVRPEWLEDDLIVREQLDVGSLKVRQNLAEKSHGNIKSLIVRQKEIHDILLSCCTVRDLLTFEENWFPSNGVAQGAEIINFKEKQEKRDFYKSDQKKYLKGIESLKPSQGAYMRPNSSSERQKKSIQKSIKYGELLSTQGSYHREGGYLEVIKHDVNR